MKSKKNYIINVVIIFVIFFSMFAYMLIVDGLNNMMNVVKSVNILWSLLSLGCIVLYWVSEALVLNIICKKNYPSQKYFNSFKINMIGQLFNNITPFSSGGQPIQAYVMKKDGKSMSSSVSILLFKFIIFQAIQVIYTFVILIFKYRYFKTMIKGFAYMAIIGFLVNLSVIVMLILVAVNKNVAYSILKSIYTIFSKMHIIKNLDEKLEKLKLSVDNFHERFKLMKKEKSVIILTSIITIIQLTAFYTIAYTVYRSFGLNGKVYINILCAQAFLTMIMSFIPTPGAGGAAEGGFYVIFSNFFTSNTINMAIMYWRVYTFYLPIIVGTIFFVLNKKEKNYGNEELISQVEKLKENDYE